MGYVHPPDFTPPLTFTGGGCTFGGWYTKGWFGVRDVYWTRHVPLSESCTLRMHVHVYCEGGGVHPPEFSQKGSPFTAALVYEHCTRRVPLSKTRTLWVHVYVYVYTECTCIRSVQLSESGTRLVQYTSSTPDHPLVYQPPKVYPPPPSLPGRIPN
jgi:hypothetical protein